MPEFLLAMLLVAASAVVAPDSLDTDESSVFVYVLTADRIAYIRADSIAELAGPKRGWVTATDSIEAPVPPDPMEPLGDPSAYDPHRQIRFGIGFAW